MVPFSCKAIAEIKGCRAQVSANWYLRKYTAGHIPQTWLSPPEPSYSRWKAWLRAVWCPAWVER